MSSNVYFVLSMVPPPVGKTAALPEMLPGKP